MFQCLKVHNVLTSIVFQSSSSTFFMGKCGAFMLQNLVTMVKRSRAKGSPLYKGEPEGSKVDFRLDIGKHLLGGGVLFCAEDAQRWTRSSYFFR